MKELLRLIPYLKRYKTKYLLGALFVTLSNVCSTTYPRIAGATIDLINGYVKIGSFSEMEIARNIALMITFTAGSGFFMFLTRRTTIVGSRLIELELRSDVLGALERLPLRYFQRTPTGELMAYATNDISAVREVLGPGIMYTANMLTTFLFVISMMLLISPTITGLALLPLPLVSFAVYKLGGKVHLLFKSSQDHYAKMTAQAQENISGVRVVRAYARGDHEASLFRALGESYRSKMMKLVRYEAATMPLMISLIGLSQLLVLAVGGYYVMAGKATIGDLTQFFIYLTQLIWPVVAVGWVSNLVQRGAASMGRLGRIFDERADIADGERTDYAITEVRGAVEFRNVRLRYSPEAPWSLGSDGEGVSFSIAAGETVGIVGETGSGKSSLVALIPRLFEATDGSVLIDGRVIGSIPLETLRRNISIVPQESFLFSETLSHNIRFGAPDAPMDAVIEASSTAQLHDNVKSFPDGYDTIVGERGVTLSGGQKQRASIARAILRLPAILIFDDALSAVDAETEEKILRGLRNVMENRTSILIAHRISTVKNADKIIVLERGRIVETGTHEELLERDGAYADMYSRQLLEDEIALIE